MGIEIIMLVVFPFLFGIPILLMAWVGLKDHRKDKKALKSGNYKEFTIKSYSLKDLTDYAELTGRDNKEKIFVCEDDSGNVIEYENYTMLNVGSKYKFRIEDGKYILMKYCKLSPGDYGFIAVGLGFILLGFILLSILVLDMPVKLMIKLFGVFIIGIPCIIAGIFNITENYRICNRRNLVYARVTAYEWKDFFDYSSNSSKTVSHDLCMYVTYMFQGQQITRIAEKVASNGRLQRKYPVGSEIKVYINQKDDYVTNNGKSNNIIIANRRFRGYLIGTMLVIAGIFLTGLMFFI